MAATFAQGAFQPSAVDFPVIPSPSSIADAAALGFVLVASAGYLLRQYTWDKPDPYNYIWYERPQEKDSAGRAAKKETRNIARKLEESGKRLVIFWGSQSGTAERFANRLARECHLRFGLDAIAADMSEYDPETVVEIPESKMAIFLLSTYGEGNPSDNAESFWNWLVKPENLKLPSLRYAAFGLGNSNYVHYNRVVDDVDEALRRNGAAQLKPVGKADDALGATEEDFESWKEELFGVLKQTFGVEEREMKHEPTLVVTEDKSMDVQDLYLGEPAAHGHTKGAIQSPIKALTILNSWELFNSKTRNCIHMELDLANHPQLTYKTGDHLAIWPINPEQEVDTLLRVLGLTERRHVPISISAIESGTKVNVPTPTCAEALFKYYLEICAPVSRDTIRNIAQFAPTEASKSYLKVLSNDKAFFSEFMSATHTTLGKLFEKASSEDPPGTLWSELPLSYLVETLPRTQPRYYSVSSSSVVSPRIPSITALVSSIPLPNAPGVSIPGLTTNYLQALSQSHRPSPTQQTATALTYDLAGPSGSLQGGKVFATIRRSKFKLPLLSSCDLIMVAAGTGLAPFRGFLQERLRLKNIGKPVGRIILFFGCRHPDEDFIYRAELEEMERQNEGLLKIITAFSRVQGKEKVYVQDRVRQLGAEVAEMMDGGASFYVCGRASMAREVGKEVRAVMMMEKKWGEKEAEEWGEFMKRKNKWQEDVWG